MRDEEAAPAVGPRTLLLSGLVQRNARFPNPSVDLGLGIPQVSSGYNQGRLSQSCVSLVLGVISGRRRDPSTTKQAREPSFLPAERACFWSPLLVLGTLRGGHSGFSSAFPHAPVGCPPGEVQRLCLPRALHASCPRPQMLMPPCLFPVPCSVTRVHCGHLPCLEGDSVTQGLVHVQRSTHSLVFSLLAGSCQLLLTK